MSFLEDKLYCQVNNVAFIICREKLIVRYKILHLYSMKQVNYGRDLKMIWSVKMEFLKRKLPTGIDDFEKLRKNDFYYIDKTGLIKDLLDNWGEVNLFTRPRRFGKSLNMSMLQSFFSIDSDPSVFKGLKIMNEEALCEKYMGQYPVISISLKGINGQTYETAFKMAIRVINEAASGMEYLLESTRLSENDKNSFRELLKRDMDETALFGSLRGLSRLLEKHYEKNTIILTAG